MKETKHMITEVLMEQFYSKVGNKVYWNYRFNGIGKWIKQLTPYNDLPWIEVKYELEK